MFTLFRLYILVYIMYCFLFTANHRVDDLVNIYNKSIKVVEH